MRAAGSMAICRLWHSRPSTCAGGEGGGAASAAVQGQPQVWSPRVPHLNSKPSCCAARWLQQRRPQKRQPGQHPPRTAAQHPQTLLRCAAHATTAGTAWAHHAQHIIHQLIPPASHCSTGRQYKRARSAAARRGGGPARQLGFSWGARPLARRYARQQGAAAALGALVGRRQPSPAHSRHATGRPAPLTAR